MTRFVPSEAQRRYGSWDGCLEMWHAELPYEYTCAKALGHEGLHESRGFQWESECLARVAVARKFVGHYRAIPNSSHDIRLNDDGTVSMTLAAFGAATRFIGLSMSGDG